MVVVADWAHTTPPAAADRQRAAASKVILLRMCFWSVPWFYRPGDILPLYLDNIVSSPAFIQAGGFQHSIPPAPCRLVITAQETGPEALCKRKAHPSRPGWVGDFPSDPIRS